MVKLEMPHINLTIFAFYAKIMRATTVRPSMATITIVPTIPDAITLLD